MDNLAASQARSAAFMAKLKACNGNPVLEQIVLLREQMDTLEQSVMSHHATAEAAKVLALAQAEEARKLAIKALDKSDAKSSKLRIAIVTGVVATIASLIAVIPQILSFLRH